MTLYNFTTDKYKKSIEFSQRCIYSVVEELATLLDVQLIKADQYNVYSPNRKLTHIYFIYDVMDLDATATEAKWVLFKIIMRGTEVVSLGGYTTVKQILKGNAALGPLYVDGELVYEYPTTKQIYRYVHSYIVEHILPELEECNTKKSQP